MIDHFMFGVPDLEAGLAWARGTLGAEAVPGGRHAALGTCNALLSLGATYLEIIAPDPGQPLAGTFGERLSRLDAPGLVTWAARGDLTAVKSRLESRGLRCAGPVPTTRTQPDGTRLDWALLFPGRHPFGGLMPFFIDWMACPHPSATSPVAGTLRSFSVFVEEPEPFQALLTGLAPGVTVIRGAPALQVAIDTAAGTVTLASSAATLGLSLRG